MVFKKFTISTTTTSRDNAPVVRWPAKRHSNDNEPLVHVLSHFVGPPHRNIQDYPLFPTGRASDFFTTEKLQNRTGRTIYLSKQTQNLTISTRVLRFPGVIPKVSHSISLANACVCKSFTSSSLYRYTPFLAYFLPRFCCSFFQHTNFQHLALITKYGGICDQLSFSWILSPHKTVSILWLFYFSTWKTIILNVHNDALGTSNTQKRGWCRTLPTSKGWFGKFQIATKLWQIYTLFVCIANFKSTKYHF